MSFCGENSLDNIYSDTPIPNNFDFLSMDVDGVDYHIFESLCKSKPKIICIEFSPAISNSVDYVQPKDIRIKHGNSAKVLTRLADVQGFDLVGSNLFFVDSNLSAFVIETKQSLDDLNPDGAPETIIFAGYDGSILSDKREINLGWHGVPIPIADKLQFLPKFLRKFKGDDGFFVIVFLFFILHSKFPRKLFYTGIQLYKNLRLKFLAF